MNRFLSLAVLTVLFCGCFSSSSPTRTFVLSKVALAKSEEPVQIRMGRIVLPDYLKRWEMVTLVKKREVRINDFAQWGELLEDGVRRTLTENFRQVLGAEQVLNANQPNGEDCWRLDYEFHSFAGNMDGAFALEVLCQARNAKEKKQFNIAFEVPYTPGKPEKLVEAHEEALGRLVLETLSQLQNNDD
jgi:uncharacterized lipoprotein YmbA